MAQEKIGRAIRDKHLIDALHLDPHPARTREASLQRVVSGGQTGVDRAALDAALAAGIPVGGWCPKGRRAEDGRIDCRYALMETPGRAYAQRTEWNVRDSDATLILFRGEISGGTKLTAELAMRYGRTRRLFDLDGESDPGILRQWLVRSSIRVLNVAGPRESGAPGIYVQVRGLLKTMLDLFGGR